MKDFNPQIQVHLRLDRELYKQMQVRTILDEKSLAEVINEAMEMYVESKRTPNPGLGPSPGAVDTGHGGRHARLRKRPV